MATGVGVVRPLTCLEEAGGGCNAVIPLPPSLSLPPRPLAAPCNDDNGRGLEWWVWLDEETAPPALVALETPAKPILCFGGLLAW